MILKNNKIINYQLSCCTINIPAHSVHSIQNDVILGSTIFIIKEPFIYLCVSIPIFNYQFFQVHKQSCIIVMTK